MSARETIAVGVVSFDRRRLRLSNNDATEQWVYAGLRIVRAEALVPGFDLDFELHEAGFEPPHPTATRYVFELSEYWTSECDTAIEARLIPLNGGDR